MHTLCLAQFAVQVDTTYTHSWCTHCAWISCTAVHVYFSPVSVHSLGLCTQLHCTTVHLLVPVWPLFCQPITEELRFTCFALNARTLCLQKLLFMKAKRISSSIVSMFCYVPLHNYAFFYFTYKQSQHKKMFHCSQTSQAVALCCVQYSKYKILYELSERMGRG